MQAVLYLEYAPIFVFIVFAFALALIIFGLSYALAINAGDPEKLSPYECGFEPFDDARNTFDIRFYLVAILFILFDLEATFLFPWATSLSNLTTRSATRAARKRTTWRLANVSKVPAVPRPPCPVSGHLTHQTSH